MRFIMTFIWSLVLVTMVNYVAGAIANVPFDFATGAIISVVVSLFIFIIGEALPEGPISDH